MKQGTDRTVEFALVRELREWLKRCDGPRSEKTLADYERKYARMVRTGFLPEQARTAQTYYAYRAALVWASLEEAKDALRRRDKVPYGSPEWSEALADLEHARQMLRRYPPDPEREHRAHGSPAFTWSDLANQKPEKPRSQSKRRVLAYLHHVPNWRERLFLHISDRHKAAAAICALSGARPAEVARGVEVVREGDGLLFRIAGAKLTRHSGQPERQLLVSLDSVEARYLHTLAESGPVTVTGSAQALCAAVERAGQRAFPHARQLISPYVYRHALASELKAEGHDPERIAECLGHRASESQSAYGRAVHGGRASGVLAVRASMPVRATHRPPPPMRQPSHTLAPRPSF